MISLSSNKDQIARQMRVFAEKQIRFAAAQAINDAVQDCRSTVPAAMRRTFRAPVARTLNSVRYSKASSSSLTASVWVNDDPGKGIAPARYLAAEIEGGTRHKKRFERALQQRGLLPGGMFVVPAESAPKDAHGDVPGSFYVRILSYLGAFGEQGYRANMTDKRKSQIAGVKVSQRGYKTITGAVYFVATGRGKTKHLKPGIYKQSGTHGAVIEPVFLFVSSATYKQRFDFRGIVLKTVSTTFGIHMRQRLARAKATAR